MKQIGDLLNNNKKAYIQITETQSICAKIITEVIQVEIQASKIQCKNTVLTISASPIIKTEIHIQQEKILKKLNQQGINITKIN